MRIIAGRWRGRKLKAPSGTVTRPTSDRAREALFSMLASRVGSFEGLRVADIFAGTGALGLEALSRGAAHCTFVERDRDALRALRANIAALGAPATVNAMPIQSAGAIPAACDLILMDPPYSQDLVGEAIEALQSNGWIAAHSWIGIETAAAEEAEPNGLQIEAQRRYGKSLVTILRVKSKI